MTRLSLAFVDPFTSGGFGLLSSEEEERIPAVQQQIKVTKDNLNTI